MRNSIKMGLVNSIVKRQMISLVYKVMFLLSWLPGILLVSGCEPVGNSGTLPKKTHTEVIHQEDPDNNNFTPPNEIVMFCGNPGSGKSSLCNSIFQQPIFPSGFSFGGGMTKEKQAYIYENRKYVDTPGLADIKDREQAAEEIEKGLKENNNYKIVFVVTLESGRIKEADLVTINTVCDAIKTPFEYGIILNQVPEKTIKKVPIGELGKYLLGLHKQPASAIIITEDENMKGEDNAYLPSNSENRVKLLNFIANLKANMILDKHVQHIDVKAYEEKIREMETKLKEALQETEKRREEQKKLAEKLKETEAQAKKQQEEQEKKLKQQAEEFAKQRQEAENLRLQQEKSRKELEEKHKKELEQVKQQEKEALLKPVTQYDEKGREVYKLEYGACGKVEIKTVYDNNGWKSKKSKFINGALVECEQINSSDRLIETYHPSGVLASKKWYRDNKLRQNFNYNEKGEKHGVYEEQQPYGGGYMKEEYRNGKKHGPYEGYHANGRLSRKGEYRDGEEYGSSFSYNEDGSYYYRVEREGFKVVREYQYRDNGTLSTITIPKEREECYDENGELEGIFEYNPHINNGYGGYVVCTYARKGGRFWYAKS